jgi:FkbM family methyltransferase
MNTFTQLLLKSKAYNTLRYATLPDFIVETLTGNTRKVVAFYDSFLESKKLSKQQKIAFDIGANKGNKTKALLKMGFKVVAVDPEPSCISTLKYRYGNNPHVTIVEKGLSNETGTATLFITSPRSGLNTMSTKRTDELKQTSQEQTVRFVQKHEIDVSTLDILIDTYGCPYFIKIDVEGFEHKVLQGLTKKPSFISFEANLPEFIEESVICIEQIKRLSNNVTFNHSTHEKLELNNWMSADQTIDFLRNTSLPYTELVARL